MTRPDDTLRERLIAAGLALAALATFFAAWGGCVWLAVHFPYQCVVVAVGLVAGLVFLRVYLMMRDVGAICADVGRSETMASEETFTWRWYCHQHGTALEPQATVNLSADVMARVYVCPFDGAVIVHTSNGLTNTFSLELLLEGYWKGDWGKPPAPRGAKE